MNLPQLHQFESHQDDSFSIKFTQDQPDKCDIKEITVSNATPNEKGEKQFSVVFKNPDPMVYEQGVYRVSHTELGEFDLFLVPVFGNDSEVHYEAVFT